MKEAELALTLYFHPFSSYCQKVLIALYEGGIAFEPRVIDLGDTDSRAELEALWPLAKFPVLRDAQAGRPGQGSAHDPAQADGG